MAVAILALLTTGLAAILNIIGRTIDQGKVISQRTRHAAEVEAVLRADVERMSRDGFLVIRNGYTSDSVTSASARRAAARLSAADRRPRERRIDELMFMARGEFAGVRPPLHPDLAVTSGAAMVYYGHGQRWSPEVLAAFGATGGQATVPSWTAKTGPYYLPDPTVALDPASASDRQAAEALRLGAAGSLGLTNPNEFAQDWTLVRRATLLTGRPSSRRSLPSGVLDVAAVTVRTVLGGSSVPSNQLRVAMSDSWHQVSLQPAVPSVFGALSKHFNDDPALMHLPRVSLLHDGSTPERDFTDRAGGVSLRPASLASGLVDVAATDPESIRTIVTRGAFDAANPMSPRDAEWVRSQNNGKITDQVLTRYFDDSQLAAGSRVQQLWMMDALPTVLPRATTGAFSGTAPGLRPTMMRMRHEPVPTRALTLSGDTANEPSAVPGATVTSGTTPGGFLRATYEANQRMLSASGFMGRCSEFIVEWSFGEREDNSGGASSQGQLVWYDIDSPYDGPAVTNGTYTDSVYPLPATSTKRYITDHAVFEAINGTASLANAVAATWCFGYSDPRDDQNARNDRPWVWPALIRITMRFVDPSDPTEESTLQYVFEVPDGEGRL